MTSGRLILLSCSCSAIASASVLRVGPGETYNTIQSAVLAASPGDTVEVAPGSYPENLVISTSPLSLVGARTADDARGRVTGSPDPAVESVIAPASGTALELASADGLLSVTGFSFSASVSAGSGVVSANTSGLAGLEFHNNHVEASPGSDGPVLFLNRGILNATVTGNVFLASPDCATAVSLSGSHAFHGLHFTNNDVIRSGAPAHVGFGVDGNANLGSSALRQPLIDGNRFEGHETGLYGGARSLVDATISNNLFTGNTGGMAAGPRNTQITANEWSGNAGYGLRLSAFGNTGDASMGAAGCTIETNHFHDNGSSAAPEGHGDLVCDAQYAGTQASNLTRNNRFESPVALFSNDPASTIQASPNYWGAPDGPGGSASGSGGALMGPGTVSYQPFFADETMNSLVFGSFPLSGQVTLESGQSITGDELVMAGDAVLKVNEGAEVQVTNLQISAGANLLVERGNAAITKLQMDPGAVLDVVDGDLSLDPAGDGQYHTISGSFTFFNCLGSLQINGNTTFAGDTLGLVSDIHVLPGSTMLVTGSLVLDGCRIDSPSTFSLLVNIGARLAMTRCETTGAAISLVGSDVMLRDNHFASSSVTAFSTVNGASIYHNIFAGGLGLLNILPGAVVTTQAEGWGNVADPLAVENQLSLGFLPPLESTRTLDAAGNLYVQPGDMVETTLDIARLNATAQAAETLLGYSTDYLAVDSLQPSPEWPNSLYQEAEESELIGRFNSAIGLSFDSPDPDGTLADGKITDIRMLAKAHEGRTRVFFRGKSEPDHEMIDTRITASESGLPYFIEQPFTINTPTLTIDGTAPVFSEESSATQLRDGTPFDVLLDGVVTRIGTVTVLFDTTDPLAGIDEEDLSAELAGAAGTFSGTLLSATQIPTGDESLTRCEFTFEITAATPDGVYQVNGLVMDRSGNLAVLPLGTLEVMKNQLAVTVAPEGLTSTPLTRDAIFTATDSGGAFLASWSVPVDFNGGSGAAQLDGVPDGTAFLSAKMAWNLRVRLPVTLDENGLGTASFTGDWMLPAGDFTGDNRVTFGDYNVMRAFFPGLGDEPDITGDGAVTFADYNIFRSNWLTAGDPE